jgi:hypothetical protein
MKLRHGALLALAGWWYLMLPPRCRGILCDLAPMLRSPNGISRDCTVPRTNVR